MSAVPRDQAGDDDAPRGRGRLRHSGRAGGIELAGKTGTAEINIAQGINDLWFIGSPSEVAVAVVIGREQGQGGPVAGPIAKQVLEALGK